MKEEKRGKIQDILRKLELLDLVHPGFGLGNWIVGAATHQGRESQKGCPRPCVCSAGRIRTWKRNM